MTRSREDTLNKAIETAIERGGRQAQPGATSFGERQEKMDQAMRQRLGQLRTAMGETAATAEPMLARLPPLVAPSSPEPIPGPTPEPLEQATGRNTRKTVLFTSVLVLLAGGAWLALPQAPTEPGAPTEATSLGAPVVATAAIEATPPVASPASSPATVPTEAALPPPVAQAEQPVPAAAIPPVATTPSSEDQLREAVEGWRQAWSDRDTDAYLAYYAKRFLPAKGQSLDQWKASRYRFVGGKSDIEVQTKNVNVRLVDSENAQVTFLQDYRSGAYVETAEPKTLLLIREDKAWRIVKEWQGEAAY